MLAAELGIDIPIEIPASHPDAGRFLSDRPFSGRRIRPHFLRRHGARGDRIQRRRTQRVNWGHQPGPFPILVRKFHGEIPLSSILNKD
ncbi:hypothetical protein QBC33DRAFT_120882 [Phialemonium atrogriseum]|uniref:Uncharacterized protein n=1 Tax=Phialemonium atrogriseum TaxID=1093897 RepID=A0AAJ0FFV8_9PEZI|nr:uncharacterized protein QBC33DRAFT_120882 [Phialemonium atrogriseum]KAK1765942.1 hypothetical protein QBC33DRAFT_120882 [Phialemonium atrogriseum]